MGSLAKTIAILLLHCAGGAYAGEFEPRSVLPPGQDLSCNGELPMQGAAHEPGAWLALVKHDDTWVLSPSYVDIMAGVVSPAGKGIQFLFLAIPELRPGGVAAAKIRKDGNVQHVMFQGVKWEWHAEAGDYPFLSVAGKKTYLLRDTWPGQGYVHPDRPYWAFAYAGVPLPESDEAEYRLEWAGDLDGDNRLDLLFGFSQKQAWGWNLWLSSAAREGELVAPVGGWAYACS